MSLHYYHLTIDKAGEIQAFNRSKVNQLSPVNIPSIVIDDRGVTSIGVFIDEAAPDRSILRTSFMSPLSSYVDFLMEHDVVINRSTDL